MAHQSVDPSVSRLKFDREIDEFRKLEDEYRNRGWFLVHATFPAVLVIMATPDLKPPALVTGVAFDYTNYDSIPPSVRLVNPFSGAPYLAKELPIHLNMSGQVQEIEPFPGAPHIQLNQIQPLMQDYGPETIPFLCLAGVREYHEHPGHSGDSWELHRLTGAGRLVRILEIIHKLGIRSIKGYSVQLVPQIGFQEAVGSE